MFRDLLLEVSKIRPILNKLLMADSTFKLFLSQRFSQIHFELFFFSFTELCILIATLLLICTYSSYCENITADKPVYVLLLLSLHSHDSLFAVNSNSMLYSPTGKRKKHFQQQPKKVRKQQNNLQKD